MTGKKERKLSSILAMDVVSYSSKMAEDDEGTLKLLEERRVIIEKHIKTHGGRIFNTAGDAFMIDFSSPVEAVKAAIKIQKEIFDLNNNPDKQKQLEFRVGINTGDVIIEGDNLFGDGVNVAARLESIAPPGRICISENVHSMIPENLNAEVFDRGPQKLKNIKKPIKAYFIETVNGSDIAKKYKINTGQNSNRNLFLSLSTIGAVGTFLVFLFFNKSEIDLNLDTIAVLPINTTSLSDSQINLAAGLTQDITTGLSRSSKKLNVIKLNTNTEELDKIATKSEARYIITGDLRSSASTLRVSVNLIDAETMKTAWSENFDRKSDIQNIFKLQDDIVSSILDALVGSGDILAKEVVKAVTVAGSQNMDAYACINFVRSSFLSSPTPDGFMKSMECLEKSVNEDPLYKEAWQYYGYVLGWSYSLFKVNSKEILDTALNATEEAIKLDPNYAEAHASKAEIEYYYKNFDEMLEAGNKAIELASNDAHVLGRVSYLFALSGWGCHASNELKEKYDIDDQACFRINKGHELGIAADKLDPYKNVIYDNFGRAPLYQDSKDWKKLLDVMEEQPVDFMWWHHYMGTANHHLGKKENAQKYFDRVIELLGGENTIAALKKEAEIWHEMTVIEEMMPVYLEYGLK